MYIGVTFKMQLSIEDAISVAVRFHESGNLKEAERLYRGVLNTQPSHPDANHNLALIELGKQKIQGAIFHFKIAIKVKLITLSIG